MYDIAKEIVGAKADNPIIIGWTFDAIKDYHQANSKAPEAIYGTNARVATSRPSNADRPNRRNN